MPILAEPDTPDALPVELIPARMLNEFAYCPRLAYLEWVQGEFAHSSDTLDGALTHARVDLPGGTLPASDESHAAPRPISPTSPTSETAESSADAPEMETFHARSLPLSAPQAGLIAVLDLLEAEVPPDAPRPLLVTPVDYKRGAEPALPERAWEPDRVQLCAQALILRENGYRCTSGILYYAASKTRVPVLFDEALCTHTLALAADLRKTVALGHIPPPLVDSPKCPRCSLVGICLPDETLLLSATNPSDSQESSPDTADLAEQDELADIEERVRPLIPARHDSKPLYVQEQGAYVRKSGDLLIVSAPVSKTKGNSSAPAPTLAEIRLVELSHVALFGNVQMTTQALSALLDVGIPVTYFSQGGWFKGFSLGLPSKNIELRLRQFSCASTPLLALNLARSFVTTKIENQRTLLRRNGSPTEATLVALKRFAEQAQEAASIPTLMGLEGMAARFYFESLPTMLKPRFPSVAADGGFSFNFEKRNRRPPADPVNALLSYAYAILAKDLTITCWSCGLDPFLGYLHQPRFGRPALALDLMEEFRPIIADSVVLSVINTGIVTPADFMRRGPAVALKPEGRKRFLQAYERRMDALITHPIFGYSLSYRRVLEVQTRLLGRVLLGEISTYPAFRVR